jgi:hypothetical protein
MMGERTVFHEALFYEFSLERHVPPEHLLRSIGPVRRSNWPACASAAFLQRDGPALDRSGC